MNVLYVVFQSLLGGHVLSASTIAKEMQSQGIVPVFAGAVGAMTEIIKQNMPFESVHIPIFHGTRQTYFTWDSFTAVRHLSEIVQRYGIDLIHAFDARSYFHAYIAGLRERIPVICTLCGGTDPYYNLPMAPTLIVFSEEQRQKMIKTFHWPAARVEVVRTRLDVRQIVDDQHQLEDEEAKSLGLDPALSKIMMISSFDSTKIRSIHKVLDAVEVLFSRDIRFQLVLIGGKGPLHEHAKMRAKQICERFSCSKLVVMTGPVMKAFRLLQRADIVLGVGRSAFEGMAYGKPTLIVGETGYAGTMSSETVDVIAWYNFSGRNQKEDNDAEPLATVINKLLYDSEQRERLGLFGREFVFREIDVAYGVQRLREIYHHVTRAEVQFSTWRKILSIATCLVPIVRDNSLHTVKERVKQLWSH